jgi:chromosome segregation ATPase
MEILEALSQIDPWEDENWTADGLPKTDVVSALVGSQVKRQEITDARPEFNRDLAKQEEMETRADAEADASRPSDTELTAHEQALVTVNEIKAELVALHQEKGRVQDRIEQADSRLGAAERHADRLSPPSDTLQQNIRAYLDRQNQTRQARAKHIQQVRESGLDVLVKSMGPAPIDAAMKNRKQARGSQRPVRS